MWIAITGSEPKATGALVIPSTINGKIVRSIEPNAFRGSTGLTKVTIPDTVLFISGSAFQDCPALTNVYFKGDTPNRAYLNMFGLETTYRFGDQGKKFRELFSRSEAGENRVEVTFKSAPSVAGNTMFSGSPDVTVYYLPGKSGWYPIFSGRPTMQRKSSVGD